MVKKPKQKELPPYQSTMERFPEHVKAIGMITVELSNLEIMMGDLLAAIIGVHPEIAHAIYFSPKASMGRIEIIEEVRDLLLSGKSYRKLHKAISKITGRARAIVGQRNDYVHVAWGLTDDMKEVSRRALPSGKPTVVTVPELNNMITSIRKLATSTISTAAFVHDQLRATSSQSKPDERSFSSE